ncbi:hypothetical protein CHELA1G11_10599 [Hyphomicrobiales bacterium]|nr:hypothetical protein CHELA1G11_10599 [Hyphomicrobiales bacterium]CAH1673542.1 hypothetical protein CHELA1G2_13704 [Hyphomicrobiales bacterium]
MRPDRRFAIGLLSPDGWPNEKSRPEAAWNLWGNGAALERCRPRFAPIPNNKGSNSTVQVLCRCT